MIAAPAVKPGSKAAVALLLVEDNAADARLVRELLLEARPHRFEVTHVTNLGGARASLMQGRFDVIILDLGLPDSQGLDTLIRTRTEGPGVPVIVLTGMDDEQRAIEAVVHGAQDYLVKGAVTGQVLRHSVTYAIERAKLEAATRERDERFRQLADNMREVFFIVEAHFRETLYISPAYEQVWGRPCESLYEQPASFLEHVVAGDRDIVLENIRRVQAGEDAGEVLFRITRPDGEQRWILTHAMPVRNARGDVYRIAGLGMDVTERQNLERQFRQSQKMEAVGRLAGGVAHDFNNLLTVITSYTSLLLGDPQLADVFRDDLAQIGKAAESAATLTRQLLAFSRQQVVEPKPIDLNDVVRDAGKILRRVIGEDITLVTKLAPDLGFVLADFGQIEQIIMNMTVNARDAMPSGGRVTLETANISVREGPAVEHFTAGPGPYVVLTIRDTGTGMTEETKARMFEPFFTTKEAGKGTGLGLSMVFGIVQQGRGYITVDSVLGEGTTFNIHLPSVSPELAADVAVSATISPRGTETVLLVEDVEALREIVRRVLVEQGYVVLDAVDAPAAMLRAEKHRGPIHLLLTDVVLPGLSGRELAERLGAARPEMKVLFTSGYTDDAVVRRGVLERGVAFMQKPFTPEVLARRVREVLG